MKTISYFMAVAAFALCTAAISFGQTQTGATVVIPSVSYQVFNQRDCPLQMSVRERIRGGDPASAPLKISNNDSAVVKAYVLHVTNGSRYDYDYAMVLGQDGLGASESLKYDVSLETDSENGTGFVISMDYVLFADGKTWGSDSLGRSKGVKSYIQGYDLAVSRLKKVIGNQDDKELMKAVGLFGVKGFGGPVAYSSSVDFFAKGYQGVIDQLRRISTRIAGAKKYARDLELMENDRQP